jgi:predicted lipoprotein with Yx(FWY)xxD motif
MKAISLIITVAAALSLAGLSSAFAAGNSGARPATVSTARTGLGRIIVNGQGRTLYLFAANGARRRCSARFAARTAPDR